MGGSSSPLKETSVCPGSLGLRSGTKSSVMSSGDRIGEEFDDIEPMWIWEKIPLCKVLDGGLSCH